MSDTNTLVRGAALTAAGLIGASLLAERAGAQATSGTHVTFYFATAPAANGTTVIQVPNTSTKAGTSTDVQVVNFALAAETIEADLYRQALARLTNGQNPDGTPATDGLGNPITGLGLGTDRLSVRFLTEFIQVETAQRDTLATVLYGSPAANPFLPGAAPLALKYAFGVPAFSEVQVVTAAYQSELRGVSGYLAGAGALSIGSPFLPVAAAALGIEGRHAASLALTLTTLGVPTETAPLPTQNAGKDLPVDPDTLLYGTANVPGGTIPPVSGPNGYVYQ